MRWRYYTRYLKDGPGGGMVDALASGASVLMDVEVRVLFWAPKFQHNSLKFLRF